MRRLASFLVESLHIAAIAFVVYVGVSWGLDVLSKLGERDPLKLRLTPPPSDRAARVDMTTELSPGETLRRVRIPDPDFPDIPESDHICYLYTSADSGNTSFTCINPL